MILGLEEVLACIQRFSSHIAPGGHLFLGHSDSPGCMSTYFAAVRVAGALCHERLAAAPRAAQIGTRLGDTTPHRDMTGLLTEGNRAAASGDLRAAVPAFRQATYLDPNVAIAYFPLRAAPSPAGDPPH